MFKTRLDTFRNDFELFWNFENFFDFVKTFRRHDPPWNTGQKEISDKSTPKHVENTFGQFGNDFRRFCNFLIFLNFFKNISKTRPSMEHWAKKIFWKNYPKTSSIHVWHFWDQFWAFMEFWKFLIFWKHFEDSTLHGTLGKKNFRRRYPKTCSKHFWTIWERFWAVLHFWNFFLIFLKTFRRLDPPWNNGQKKIFEKITPKHVQNLFGHFRERFWAFLKIWNFFDFLKTFRRLDPPSNTGQKNFSKKVPQNMFITLLDSLGTILSVCGFLIIFKFL